MKKIDWYIVGKYLRTFFFVLLIFSLVTGVVDFSDKIDEMIKEQVSVKMALFDYYLFFFPYINGLLWSLYALIAVIFFTSRMAYNSEIISIFNAGVSFRRFMVPYMISAVFAASLLLVANHYFIPKGNKTRLDIVHEYIWRDNDKGKTRDVHMFISPDTKIYVNFYRKRDSTANKFRMERFEDGELVYLLKAHTAKWKGYPNNWSLRNYEIRHFDGLDEELILGKGARLDTAFALTPDDFVDFLEQQTMMTTPQLRKHIQTMRNRGVGNTQKYEIELHRRTADAFTIFILAIIGMSIAARKVRGGMGLHLAVGIGLGALFIFLSRFSIVFATGQAIPVLLGIWIPNLVFSVVAIYLVSRAQK